MLINRNENYKVTNCPLIQMVTNCNHLKSKITMKRSIVLTDYAYELLGTTRPIVHEKLTVIGKGVYESGGSAKDSFDRIQTAYHGIPEHLIPDKDHDNNWD